MVEEALDGAEVVQAPQRVWTASTRWIIIDSAVIVLVFLAGFAVQAIPGWTDAEFRFLVAVDNVHTPVGDAIALSMSWLFSPLIGSCLVLVLLVVMAAGTRRLEMPARMAALVIIPWLGSDLIKVIVRRPRPDVRLLPDPLLGEPTTFSYPSGHTAFATAICLGLLIVLWRTRWRQVLVVVAIAIPILMASCRVYLGVHYPSDVIAGLIYTTAAVGLVHGGLSLVPWPRRRPL